MDNGQERRFFPLSDEQLDAIAERAAEKALDKVYAEVGKNVLKKAAWIVGVAIAALSFYLLGKGHIDL